MEPMRIPIPESEPRHLTEARTCVRGVLVLDLENLLHPYIDHDLSKGLEILRDIVRTLEEKLVLVMKIASCSRRLAQLLAFPLAELGVRTYVHGGGPDAADEDLVRRLETGIPRSCEVVVIGSGDHRFALPARRLRNLGRHVAVVARPGSVANALRRVAGGCTWFRAERPDQAA